MDQEPLGVYLAMHRLDPGPSLFIWDWTRIRTGQGSGVSHPSLGFGTKSRAVFTERLGGPWHRGTDRFTTEK